MIRTLIWAHRGASAMLPENTLAAFAKAVQFGADGLELDVQRTADGVLVVTHDEDCLRVTGQPGEIAKMTLAELKQLNFASFSPNAAPEAIPTLAEVFDLIRPSSLTINIEMKNALVLYPGLEAEVLKLAAEWNMQERVQLSSFNHYSLLEASKLIRAMKLAVPCGPLYNSGLLEPWKYAAAYGFAAIHPHYGNLRIPGLVADCHQNGIAVNAWTIDIPEHIGLALKLGVDAIITNVPEQALLLREQIQ
jgi:glycerophosphoryl diester phosphodiesterase